MVVADDCNTDVKALAALVANTSLTEEERAGNSNFAPVKGDWRARVAGRRGAGGAND